MPTTLDELPDQIEATLRALGEISPIVGERIWQVRPAGEWVECWLAHPAPMAVAQIRAGELAAKLQRRGFTARLAEYGQDGNRAPHVEVRPINES